MIAQHIPCLPKLLIVDNSPGNRAIYIQYLKSQPKQSYYFLEAESLEGAVQVWHAQSPDLVLLDLQLPDGDGLEFLKAIRTEPASQLPVIIVADQGDPRVVVQAMKLGAAEYLLKEEITSVSLQAYCHQVCDRALLTRQLTRSHQQEAVIAEMALRIRKYLSLDEIFQAIVEEVRAFVNADRVVIYQFNPDMSGTIVAEDVIPPWQSCLLISVMDTCFQENLGGNYRDGHYSAVSDIYAANLTACHIQLLERYQVRANLVVPILLPNAAKPLWGLLVVHQCAAPRDWEATDIRLLQQLSVHLAIAIQQATLYQNLQTLNASLERKVAERTHALAASERKFRGIFDNTFHLTGVLAPDGTLLEANQTALIFKGLQLEDVVNCSFWETPWWDVSQVVREQLRGAIAQAAEGKFIRYEVEILTAETQLVPVDFSLRPVWDEAGQVVMLIAEGRDISAAKQLEATLRHQAQVLDQVTDSVIVSEATNRAIINAIPDLLIRMNRQGEYLEMLSGGSLRKVLMPPAGLEFPTGDDWLPTSIAVQRSQVVEQAFKTGMVQVYEQHLELDGEMCWEEVRVSPIDQNIVLIMIRDVTERKQAEVALAQLNQELEVRVAQRTAALRESDERWQLALQGSDASLWDWNIKTGETFRTKRWRELRGLSEHESGSTPEEWTERIHLDDRDRVLSALADHLAQKTAFYQEEYRIQRKDGSHIWILDRGQALWDETGVPIRIIGSEMDISRRKEAELEAQLLWERLQFVLSSSPAVIFTCQPFGNYAATFVSDNILNLSGYTATEVLANANFWVEHIHPQDAPQILAGMPLVLEQGKHIQEYRFLHKAGYYLWARNELRLVRDAHGNPLEIVGYFADISDRKQLELALRASQKQLSDILNSADAGIIGYRLLADGTFEYDYYSKGCEAIFGYTEDEFVADKSLWLSRVPPEDLPVIETVLKNIQAKGESGLLDYRFRHSNGCLKWISATYTTYYNAAEACWVVTGVNVDITQRKTVEEALKQSEATNRALMEAIPDALVRMRRDGQQMGATNVGAIRYLGGHGAVDGHSILEILPLDIARERISLAEQALQTGQLQRQEYQFLNQGQVCCEEARIVPLLKDDVLVVVRDITSRKRAEAELKRLSERLTLALKSAAIGCWDWDLTNNTTIWDDRICELYEVSRQTDAPFDNEVWRNRVHPDDLAPTEAALQQALMGEADYDTEFRIVLPDGRIRFIKTYGMVVRDAEGKPRSMIGINFDISDRKQVELSLRQSEEFKQRLIESSSDCIKAIDLNGYLVYLNEGGKCLLEVDDLSVFHNTKWVDFWPAEYHPSAEAALIQAINGELARFQGCCPTARGNLRWWDVVVTPIFDDNGQVFQILATSRDITERKQYEVQLLQTNEELARATRLKDEFLANMSHELRTPLNAILGMSEALQEELLGSLNERQQQALSIVEKSGRHLLELINDILDLAKIASGNMELYLDSVLVENLCESSLLFVKQQAFQKGIKITSHISKSLKAITLDERRMRQVLINLLTNAVKFTPEGGQVSLTVVVGRGNTWDGLATVPPQLVAQDSPLVLFQITDTGIGITETDLRRLFQPFVQIDSNLNRQQTGTGLGLAMVKQITELHGGQVIVESSLGQGSCFTVALPYRVPVSSELVQPLAAGFVECMEAEIEGEGAIAPLILLAEDNETNVATFRTYLEARNYRMLVVRDGAEAVAMARTHRPDLILMDIQMPGIDGLEAIRRIRADARLDVIPIIAMTALVMPGDQDHCMNAGANQYLSKPVSLKHLLEVIRQFLDP
ncbi:MULTISPECIES: PAS domain-containing protein [unclassified Leptolyngbya]|uniref:PAS domain-containing protein n=1 Tax=unclassified Leptolyngbya TaxID=2650499 RepID=UPI001685476F|nr:MULTISPECIES: PAS domain-containing protein [unclassified Leptolyngbya]MBD1912882.1 PAS domain-containing protein [Leptolyngbya sp. FACHB-8]MBD2154789.1 PAS domain-containing protein [Leptolyngbya sp. FACHB-16]